MCTTTHGRQAAQSQQRVTESAASVCVCVSSSKPRKTLNMCACRYPAGAGLLKKHTQQRHHTNGGVEASKRQWYVVSATDTHPTSHWQQPNREQVGVHESPAEVQGLVQEYSPTYYDRKLWRSKPPKTPEKKRTCQQVYQEQYLRIERIWSKVYKGANTAAHRGRHALAISCVCVTPLCIPCKNQAELVAYPRWVMLQVCAYGAH